MATTEALPSTTAETASADDAVHFNQAAKALDVSRKTVERLVKRGVLKRDVSRDSSGQEALVTKRSLVAELERRRGEPVDVSRLSHDLSKPAAPQSLGSDLRELVEPLMEQVIEARTEAAGLQAQVRMLEERAHSSREHDELLAALVVGSWRERRQARRSALSVLARRTG